MSKPSGCNLSFIHFEPTTPSEFHVLATTVRNEDANLRYESGIHNEAQQFLCGKTDPSVRQTEMCSGSS